MEPRKASEILLELESKIDLLLNIVRTQDFNIKNLSNKINEINEKSKQNNTQPLIQVEAVSVLDKKVSISNENSLPIENTPKGFRRTSRPETYSGDDKFLGNSQSETIITPKFPTQIPKMKTVADTEVIVPKQAYSPHIIAPTETVEKNKNYSQNNVPLIQRVVSGNGKSVFLADIEIINIISMESVLKTRTNGTGKWIASLPIGEYRIFIRKREVANKNFLEVVQDVIVDGTQSPLELKTVIIK